ncbi:MAG: 5-oxoprolinase subunit PxpA [Pseudomonadota bacterium]
MLLNCDLGESFGRWSLGCDEEVMPFLDQANVACGFHAGDPVTIGRTLELAARHRVQVGAHPSYPDLAGFGRRSMALSDEELRGSLHYQISALDGMAAIAGLELAYVKPHGALYNDMMADDHLRGVIMDAVAAYPRPLRLMLQATPDAPVHRGEASERGLLLFLEAFADRRYEDNGRLQSRRIAGAVHERSRMLEQVAQLLERGSVETSTGQELPLQADTLCVHGDNEAGIQAIREMREMIASA